MARPRSDIQHRVLRAARDRFLAEGVDGASLRTIAQDAGTNVGMVFYYFPTKDHLFLAVVEEVYAKLLDDLGAALGKQVPLPERLEAVFARLGRASDDELAVIRLVVREALLSHERFGRVFARAQTGHVGMLLATLAHGVQEGVIDASVPPALLLLSTAAMGALPQLVRRAAGDRAPFATLPEPDALAKASVKLLMRAIGAPHTGARSEPDAVHAPKAPPAPRAPRRAPKRRAKRV
jgi:AcrR family transcriptional regulator